MLPVDPGRGTRIASDRSAPGLVRDRHAEFGTGVAVATAIGVATHPREVVALDDAEHDRAGLAQNALDLLRPDSYVAFADPSGSPQALERYFADQKITPGP